MKRMFVMLAAAFAAGAGQAADLLDIYREASQADTKFASAKMALEAGREKYPQARAALLPTLALTGSSTYTNLDASLASVREYGYNSNVVTLQLTQPLFRPQSWIALKQGELQVSLAETQYAAAQMDLIQRATQAYFDLLNAQDVLNTVAQLKKAASEQLQLSKKSFEVGTVTVTDVNDAQAQFDLASAQEIAAQNEVNVKREALRVLINKEPPELARLRQGVTLAQPQPTDAEAWSQAAVKDNLEVRAQEIAREIARREVQRSRAGHLPTVDAVGSISRTHATASASSQTESLYRNWSVGVQASLPLFAGGGTQSKVRESLALADKAESDAETARRNASQAARQSYLGVTSGTAQVKGYEAAVASTTSSLESNKLGYQVGVKINKDVLDAQSKLADAQQKLAKARYDTLLAQVKLKAAVGVLSIKDLEEINALLDR